MTENIYVTKPYLPELADFLPYLEQIWENKILTNGGPFHQQLEQELAAYLDVRHISLFSNGTLALITALQALGISGEVITTPYSFVATAHSLVWNGIKPIFVDIESQTLNLDSSKIEAAITAQTSAIMPVHCYGNPCDVEEIQKIATKNNLKIIYDAAHAFGIKRNGVGLLNYGDLSVVSFHATKVFNTFEGGAIISQTQDMKTKIDRLKNFGFVDEVTVVAPGINGKMNEIISAFGLLQLKNIDKAMHLRGNIDKHYRSSLKDVAGIHCLPIASSTHNFTYFPILIQPNYPLSRDALYDRLKGWGINARRYFYPLISDFPMYRHLPSAAESLLKNARDAADKVLCLPIYPDLDIAAQNKIIQVIRCAK